MGCTGFCDGLTSFVRLPQTLTGDCCEVWSLGLGFRERDVTAMVRGVAGFVQGIEMDFSRLHTALNLRGFEAFRVCGSEKG